MARGGPRTVGEWAERNASELGRITVSRRGLLVGGGVAAAALAGFPLARAAFRAGGGTSGRDGWVLSGRHLSLAPTAAGDATGGMRVTAQLLGPSGATPAAGLRAVLDLGDAPGAYGTAVPARIVHLFGAIPGGPAGSQFYVKAALTGLHPGTAYSYRIRLSDGTVTGDAAFVTPPASPAPFTFTAFADVGTNTRSTGLGFVNGYAKDDPVAGPGGTDPAPAATQAALMGGQRPAFTLLAGDICYADPTGSGLLADDRTDRPAGTDPYDPYVWDTFLAGIDREASSVPWLFGTGNHDMEGLYGAPHGYAGHAVRLDLPDNGPPGCPSVYRFTYGNVGVVSVDANELSAEIATNRGYSGGAQQRWLEDTLRTWRSDRRVDFIVAFFHHCAYSSAPAHASDGGIRDAVDGLFSRWQVDLAVQGHNHVLERTDPIRDGRPTRAAPDGSTVDPATDGTTYVCVGSGGRSRTTFPPTAAARYRGVGRDAAAISSYVWVGDHVRQRETVSWSRVRYDGYAFLAVDVVPARPGRTTTMTVRTLADALPGRAEPYTEIDRVVLRRTAGRTF